ncbi:MAG: division/cell wall cluster transcriptional repressor MraZ [Candidatus Blackburnbacteria bacterium]|nr:division/cell wall cluster transcriptional repressor MraZ [Candidatus Blackburnbacteria bacterium]
MLIGQYHTRLSGKGRTAVPVRFREELGETIVVSRWYEGSLAIFAQKAWERMLEVAVGGSLLTRPTRETERFLLGGAYEIRLDAQGRFVIPRPLREYARLTNEVVFVGLRDRAEVWNKKDWIAKEEDITKRAEKLIEEVQQTKTQNEKEW